MSKTFSVDMSFGPGLGDYLAQLNRERAAAAASHPEKVATLMEGLAHVIGYLHGIKRLGSAPAVPAHWIKGRLKRSRRRCEPTVWPDAKETSVILANQKLREAIRSVQGVTCYLHGDQWDYITDPGKWQFVNDTHIRWIDPRPITEVIAEAEAWVRKQLGNLLPGFMGV